MSITEMLENYVSAQGWNEDSQILILLNFLELAAQKGDITTSEFNDFLGSRANEENEVAKDL